MGIRISNLPAIATPALSDIFPVVQSGVTYKESFTQLTSLFATSGINSNITSMTGLTGLLQAPTGIGDASGNYILRFFSVASAVNYIGMQNSITGTAPQIASEGSDTNVDLLVAAKGTGTVDMYSAATTTPFSIFNGTLMAGMPQHRTFFAFSNTNATQTVTFPDTTGTAYIYTKANGTEAANAVTASGTAGVITTSALTTASGSAYAITWTNTSIATSSVIILSLMGGTNTRNTIELMATAGNGTSTLTITNNNAAALNGTVIIGYLVIP
jgi:hypothetical protein